YRARQMSDKITENDRPEAPPADGAGEPTIVDEAAAGDAEQDAEIAIEVEAPEGEGGVQEEAPTDPVAELEGRVAALELEKKETFDRLLRATADLDNYRKRARRDVDDAKIAAKGNVLKEMLPVVDNLERAVQHAESSGDGGGEAILEGVRLVLRQFLQAFERCDVTPLESLGQPFDPNLHEAVGQAETDDYPPGTVCQELQRGYKIGDRLLRPALTVVARPVSEPAEPAGPNGHDTSEGDPDPTAGSGEPETDAE
ncbi:MAG TPA: nucleotide exchange factor GrpE, partial [Kofleriaceae bacterium]|nr:nucleotide exchange factor GrpE [Kofleriaceae bacterium]